MKLAVIDAEVESRAGLIGRVQEALRQADIPRVEVTEVDLLALESFDWDGTIGCVIGPSCASQVEELVARIRSVFPDGSLALVVDAESYTSESVSLRKRLSLQVISIGDLAQLAGFIIDCDARCGSSGGSGKCRAIVGFCQFKGGVGVTSLVAGFAGCWARHGLSVAALDLDDVNPQLSAWARVGMAQKAVISDFLRTGDVPPGRVNELVAPVESFDGRFVVIGQPDAYNEGFHFKANVLEGAPSSSDYINSLIGVLKAEFDIILIDMGRSWGVSTFACLPHCNNILLVTDDDGMSVRRTLDCLSRLKSESGESEEFDFSKWSLLLNSFTGFLITPKEIAVEIQEMELFPAESNLWSIPFSDAGRQWGAPGQTFYDCAEPRAKDELRKIAHSMVPFRFEREQTFSTKLIKKWQSIVQPG